MIASLQIAGRDGDTKLVINSVTNPLTGSCHQFAKPRTIQGNEITTFREARATEGN